MAEYGKIKVEKGLLNTAVRRFLTSLLEEGMVDSVLAPRKVHSGKSFVQTLASDPKSIENISPISPVMPINSAKIVSDITILEPSPKKIAVVLKPCEMRALVELVKLNQASLENIITIGMDCVGTYSVVDFERMVQEKKNAFNDYTKLAAQGKDVPGVRTACQVCEYPVSELVDINICLVGYDTSKGLILKANTKEGEEIIKKLGIGDKDDSKRERKMLDLIATRIANRDRMMQELTDLFKGEDHTALLEFFSTCIGCRNCVSVCPICYCRECFFDSQTFDQHSERYLKMARRKGMIKMPTDTLLFQVTRFVHMVTSCVACGMCEQACPSGIPLLSIYKTVGFNAQKEFDYVPGRDIEEELPLTTFREDELEPR